MISYYVVDQLDAADQSDDCSVLLLMSRIGQRDFSGQRRFIGSKAVILINSIGVH